MLSGAGLVKGLSSEQVHFHQTTMTTIDSDGIIDLTDALEATEQVCATAPIYVLDIDAAGDLTGGIKKNFEVGDTDRANNGPKAGKYLIYSGTETAPTGNVMVDYYVKKAADTVSELQIDAEHFAGYFYVEADTLFRRQSDGKDLPANLTLPNVKIQSNFTFSMASTGDPSTFTFTMDAFPGYTYFDRKKKVLCAIQIVDDAQGKEGIDRTVFPHLAGFDIDESKNDSVAGSDESFTAG